MDTIRVGTHCFGSREGYRTLARSADVTDAEDAELGGFGFGQSADPAFLESLEREPSAFGRPLGGGRIAITRIFQGDPDEAGRATLELRTILVAAPDIAPLAKAGLGGILQLPGLWKREAFRRGQLREILVPEPLALRDPADAAAAATLFDAWAEALLLDKPLAGPGLALRAAEDRPVIVVEPATLGSTAITTLASQLPAPDLARLRWGVRLVSTAGPVDLCTLAAAGRSGGRREVRRVRLDAAVRPPSTELGDRPLALARVAAERSMERDGASASASVWRPVGIAAGVVIAMLLIAQGTWMWISARLDRDQGESQGTEVAQAASVVESTLAPIVEPTRAKPADTDMASSSNAVRSNEVATEDTTESRTEASVEPAGDRGVTDQPVAEEPPIEGASGPDERGATDGQAEATPSETSPSDDSDTAGEAVGISPTVDSSDEPVSTESGEAMEADEAIASDEPASGDSTADAASPPAERAPDPCAECAALAGRFVELAEDARRAEAFGDREALEATARSYVSALQELGLDRLDQGDPTVQPRVMARVRDRPGSAAVMPADWPWWREMLCRLEALESAIANLEVVASQLAGRGAPIRQELMRLRKDSTWILGSERADADSLRAAISRLRRNLAADCAESKPSREEQPRVEAIHAWLLLEPSSAGGSEGRFDPPGGEVPVPATQP